MILRRGGWRTAEELEEAAARSTAEGERMPDDVRWIRSYVLEEGTAPSARSASTRRRARRRSARTRRPPTCRSTRSSLSPTPCSSGPIRAGDRLEREIEMKKSALVLALAVLPVLVAVGIAAAAAARSTARSPRPPVPRHRRGDRGRLHGRGRRPRRGSPASPQPGEGAMGVHMLNPSLLDGTIDAAKPEAARLRAAERRHAEARRARVPRLPVRLDGQRQAVAVRPGVRRRAGGEPLRAAGVLRAARVALEAEPERDLYAWNPNVDCG